MGSLAIAALFHDAGHRGVSNNFLRMSEDALVEEFGRESTQEAMHASVALRCLEDDPEILPVEYRHKLEQISELVAALILSTDMAGHAELEALLSAVLDESSGWVGSPTDL